MTRCSRSPGQRQPGVAQHRADVGEEQRALLTVHRPVVERHRQLADPSRLDALSLTVPTTHGAG